jgi:PAS domain S-box-containing protein
MRHYTATEFVRWVERVGEKTLRADRLDIGPRLILCFVLIILSMLAGDAVVLWQFHLVRAQAERLNGVEQKLVAVLRVHTSLLTFHDRLEELAESEDADRVAKEAGPLRSAVLEDTQRATSALSFLPSDVQRDQALLPTLHVIQSALPLQVEAITSLAGLGDWRAVRARLANQIRPLESQTSALVEKFDYEVGEEQAQIAENTKRVEHRVFLIVPMTAVFTLLIAVTLGLAITRSITQPLERLVEGSKALASGDLRHEVIVEGNNELAVVGRAFNHAARELQQLYEGLRRSEKELRDVIETVPAMVWSTLPDGSLDFINRRWQEFTGLVVEDALGWNWEDVVHPDDHVRFVADWRAALSAGQPMESELRVLAANGQYRWLFVRNVPLRDELGKIVKWYGASVDVEERKRAEEELRQAQAAQFEMSLEARVSERTRIARELHDTLLQSFQGLLLRFQTVSNQLPEGKPKETLDSAIDRAAEAITEGRDAIQGLRLSTVETNDLALAIKTLGEDLATGETNPNVAAFHVGVEGTPRDLHPILRDDLYRIAGEALRNAFRHAQAQRIEVEIRYDERQLRLWVRDDGKGIDWKLVSEDGRPGHFGLCGIRERAKSVGGKLTVWSELDCGTELELTIPASIAYAESSVPGRSWLSENLSGKNTERKS